MYENQECHHAIKIIQASQSNNYSILYKNESSRECCTHVENKVWDFIRQYSLQKGWRQINVALNNKGYTVESLLPLC